MRFDQERTLALRWVLGVSLALVILTAALYWQVSDFDFVWIDDPVYIFENANVQTGLNPGNVRWAFTTDLMGNWHPLTWLSLMLDVELFGMRSGPMHVMNVMYHVGATIFLYLAFRTMTGRDVASAFVAAVFAVHPLHVESVAWVTERKDVLSALFGFAALWTYAHYLRDRSRTWKWLTFVALTASLFSKATFVTFPFLLLVIDFWPGGRMQSVSDAAASRRPWAWLRELRPLVLEKWPLFGLCIVFCVVTLVAQSRAGSIAAADELPLTARLGNAVMSYGIYLRQMFFPFDLDAFYPMRVFDGAFWRDVALSATALLVITLVAWQQRVARPFLLSGWLWYLGTSVPVIGLIQAGSQAHADRYTYIPSVGISLMVAWGIPSIWPTGRQQRALLAGGALAVIVLACGVAYARIGVWRDTETLAAHSADHYRSHLQAGLAAMVDGQLDTAIREFQAGLQSGPNVSAIHSNLALALTQAERPEEARYHADRAVELAPHDANVLCARAVTAAMSGDVETAMADLRRALEIEPQSQRSNFLLATLLLQAGKTDEGIRHLEMAKNAGAPNARIIAAYASALAEAGRDEEARQAAAEAKALSPDDPIVNELGAEIERHKRSPAP